MKSVLSVALLTILATLFYTYVGHMVPQKITYPPEDVALSSDMTTEEMVKAGEEIVGGKGTCLSCHTIGSHNDAARFPDLGGIGARAGSRREGYTDVEYLSESLYEPNAYIVEGFNPGMVAVSKPPISLSDQEILSVIAYLQSLGGTPTVTMDTKTKYTGSSPAPSAAPAAGAAAAAATAAPSSGLSGTEIVTTYGCVACHNLDEPVQVLGPSLYDVGNRLSEAELYQSIMDPDAVVSEGFLPGLMMPTLEASGFYEKVSAADLKTLVAFLQEKKGDQ